MKLALRVLIALLLAVAAVAAVATPPLAAAQPPAAKVYVCPMPDHTQEFDHPGQCPLCGMDLVDKGKLFQVAVLVFNHAEDIDFTAPIEVLGQAGARVFTVAATTDPVTTVFGLHLRPDYDLAHAPAADLILVPGGGVDGVLHDEQVLAWIRQRAGQARYVMSVCNGAFILARTGLLDGLAATTTAEHIDELAAAAPKVHLVRERFVDNGKVITTGGLSAGIDGALHVVEREYGRVRAEDVARGIEYRWQPDLHWTRSTLADLRLTDIRLPANVKWEKLASAGDTRQWQVSGRLEAALSADEILADATKQIAANGWTPRDRAAGKRTFTKTDEGGHTWITTLTLVPDGSPTTWKQTMSVRELAANGR